MNQMGISYRWLDESHLHRIKEIDRSERIVKLFRQTGDELTFQEVDWVVPNWALSGEGDHAVGQVIAFCSEHLRRGGYMRGAFSGQTMIGIGILDLNIRPAMAQLAFLHVSRTFRRQAIGSQLMDDLTRLSIKQYQNSIYVSATPSGSAVGFYLRRGFKPVVQPLEELYDLEPEDIHMVLAMDRNPKNDKE